MTRGNFLKWSEKTLFKVKYDLCRKSLSTPHQQSQTPDPESCSAERLAILLMNGAIQGSRKLMLQRPDSLMACVGCRLQKTKSQFFVGWEFRVMLGGDWSELRKGSEIISSGFEDSSEVFSGFPQPRLMGTQPGGCFTLGLRN